MNFYNEWDGFAADWLESLIEDGLIPNGVVDRRSITDIDPEELNEFTQCHFFAGIGGWSRALQLAGWSPDRPVWTGSPPCQSFSTAGKGKGKDDERHLWPVFFNLIRECQPPTVFGEQVAAAIRHGWLDDLQTDFEREGYAAGAVVLPAGGIGAPHKRDRLFFTAKRVGNSSSKSSQRRARSIPRAQEECGRERLENGNLPDRYSDASEVHTAVADSNVSNRRTKQEPEQQARDQWRQPDGNGGIISSVADSHNERHERSSGDGRQAQRGTEHSGSVSMAYTDAHGREQGMQQVSRRPSERSRSDSVSSGFLGNSDNQRLQMHREHGELYLREPDRKNQNRFSSDSGLPDRSPLAYSKSGGRRQEQSDARRSGTGVGSQKPETGGLESGNTIGRSSVGYSNSDRSQQGNEAAETAGHRDTADSAGIRAETLGNSEHDGSHESQIGRGAFETSDCSKKGQDVSCESEGAGRSEIARDIRFWDDSTTIYCRDGKNRPIPTEPALFPLANGISNRVGLLRGAGNAIVPQAAAEIIKAYLESNRPNVFEKLP